MQELAAGLDGRVDAEVQLLDDREVPLVALDLPAAADLSAFDVLRRLETGTPAIYADPSVAAEGRILFGPMSLKKGEPALIAERMRGILAGGRR
jgi:hypothetical protein